MANENEKMELKENDIENSFDFDELETKLQNDLDLQLSELEFLKEDREKIGNPENLGTTVMSIVWEQFMNQIAVTAGEDFIKENRELTLNLRDDAHIQTTKNFNEGNIVTHNDKIDYQERYNNWQDSFQKNDNGEIKTRYDKRSNSEKNVLNKDAREQFDKNREQGSTAKHKDHIVSVGEIIRDPEVNTHLSKEEQIGFANSPKNIQELDSAANISKGDSTIKEFLNAERNGKKTAERFNIDEEKLRENDRVAREELEKVKAEGERKSVETGKQSQKEEAFRIGGKALRSVVMNLLAGLVKEIIAKLVNWFKYSKKGWATLTESLKDAIHSFIGKMKTHLINAGETVFKTIATAIIGPIFSTIQKTWTLLKQGWKSLKDAINYIKNPANKGKTVERLLLEVGKIIITGLTATGALVFGDVIEKGLMTIPIFAFEIPLLGSLANILGIFLGAVVTGIIGAIAINLLDKLIAKKQKEEIQTATIEKGNQIIAKQQQIHIISEALLERDKENAQANISGRHQAAGSIMKEAYGTIMENFVEDCSEVLNASVRDEEDVTINKKIEQVSNDLDDLLEDLNKG